MPSASIWATPVPTTRCTRDTAPWLLGHSEEPLAKANLWHLAEPCSTMLEALSKHRDHGMTQVLKHPCRPWHTVKT